MFADGKARYEFCQWLTRRDRNRGYLTDSLVYMQEVAEPLDGSPDLAAFYTIVDTPRTGAIRITSDPPAADVYSLEDQKLGTTPLVLEDCALGPVAYRLRKAGYSSVTLEGTVDHLDPLELAAILEPNRSVIFGYPWNNSLGMLFVPAGQLMVSAFETRVQDYEAYWETEDRPDRYYQPGFPQGPDHPVVNVKLSDAMRFCKWLTEKDRELERIQPHQFYRLPTDLEWSFFAGLSKESGESPEARDGGVKGVYPWGIEWPPPPGGGNFADVSASHALEQTLTSYEDGFVRTAPVGTFEPNEFGLYDLAGNVWEWVSDPYSSDPRSHLIAMRGGSWQDANADMLLSSARNVTSPQQRYVHWGFRVVLEDPSLLSKQQTGEGPGYGPNE